MRSKLVFMLVLMVATGFFAGAALADKLLCISEKNLKGEITVAQCLAQGNKVAVVDEAGIPRVMEGQALEVFKAINPNAMQMKAYGIGNMPLAPNIPVIAHNYAP